MGVQPVENQHPPPPQSKSLDNIGIVDDHMLFQIQCIADAQEISWYKVQLLYLWVCGCVADLLEDRREKVKTFVRDCNKLKHPLYVDLSPQDLEAIRLKTTVNGIMEVVKISKQWLDVGKLEELYRVNAKSRDPRVESYMKWYRQLLQYICCKVLVKKAQGEPLLCMQQLLQGAKTSLRSSGVLAVVYDLDYEQFNVKELLNEKECLEKSLGLPAGHLDCIRVEDGCVAIYWFIDKHYIARIMFNARCIFWRLLEHRVISLELLGSLKLSLKGRHVPYLIRDALLTGQDLIQQTEVKNVL